MWCYFKKIQYNDSDMGLKYLLTLFSTRYKKAFSINCRGYSFIEVMISVGALSVFAILVHSMLLLGHSFMTSQKNLFTSFQISQMIKQKMCMSNSSFKSINFNENNSYGKKVTTLTKTDGNGVDYTVHQRDYRKLGTTADSPILALDILGVRSESNAFNFNSSTTITQIVDNSANTNIARDSGNNPTHYKVYQDSHTVVKLNFDPNTITQPGGFISGYIFASRCVQNTSNAFYNNSGIRFTFNPNAQKKSAIHILENLNYKPYYFPSTERSTTEVMCCTDGELISTCQDIDKWVPRIYVIHLVPGSNIYNDPSGTNPFSGEIASIQELPEIQDLNNIWGMGFILSVDSNNYNASFTQSAFQLDTMVLKNSCSTSVGNVQKCADLSLGVDISTQSLTGIDSVKMIDFITSDISSCAGYSSGVDTTSLINL